MWRIANDVGDVRQGVLAHHGSTVTGKNAHERMPFKQHGNGKRRWFSEQMVRKHAPAGTGVPVGS
jgi:hypothetical protein